MTLNLQVSSLIFINPKKSGYPRLVPLLCFGIHFVNVFLVMLLQLVALELEARCHQAIVHIPLLVVEMYSLYPLKSTKVALLSSLVQLITHSLSDL